MTAERKELMIRRILAAFDASTASPGALEAVAEFAARLRAELDAVFVQDQNLQRLAQLPFVQHVTSFGTVRRMMPEDVEAETRSLVVAAERRLARAATERRIAWSFRTVQGRMPETVATAGTEVDVVVLETALRPFVPQLRMRADIRSAVQQAGCSVLLLGPGGRLRGPVAVLYEGQIASKAVRTAAVLARALRVPLDIVILSAADRASESLLAEAHKAVPSGTEARFGMTETWGDLEALSRHAEGGVLVLPKESIVLRNQAAWDRLSDAAAALFVVH